MNKKRKLLAISLFAITLSSCDPTSVSLEVAKERWNDIVSNANSNVLAFTIDYHYESEDYSYSLQQKIDMNNNYFYSLSVEEDYKYETVVKNEAWIFQNNSYLYSVYRNSINDVEGEHYRLESIHSTPAEMNANFKLNYESYRPTLAIDIKTYFTEALNSIEVLFNDVESNAEYFSDRAGQLAVCASNDTYVFIDDYKLATFISKTDKESKHYEIDYSTVNLAKPDLNLYPLK